MGETKQERRVFWANHCGEVRHVVGYDCRRDDPTAILWWVPELGESLCYGHHLFDDEADAVKAARAELDQMQHILDAKKQRLGGGTGDGKDPD